MIGTYIITFIRWSTLAKSCVLMDNLKQRNIHLIVFNLGFVTKVPLSFISLAWTTVIANPTDPNHYPGFGFVFK